MEVVSVEIVLEAIVEFETTQQDDVNLKEKKAKDTNLRVCGTDRTTSWHRGESG